MQSVGWELVYDSADNSSEKTVTLVQNFITQECDAIYVYTVDAGTQLTVQNMCEAAGVHVAFTGLMERNCVEICDNEAAQGKREQRHFMKRPRRSGAKILLRI